jgi:hypothetical protein
MSGLAIASLVQSGFDLRWIAVTQATEVGLILLAVPLDQGKDPELRVAGS